MIQIKPRRITADNFVDYGSVVQPPTDAPTAQDESFTFWSDVANYHVQGATEIGLCTVYAQADRPITWMERHEQTPELLVPIDAPFVLPVMSVEGGAEAVKIEGGGIVVEIVEALVDSGIPVMGHIGLTPQSIFEMGGYRVQGRTKELTDDLIKQALALQDAGVFSIVIELVPTLTAQLITEALDIPTIGIGAGPHCDGQVLVLWDMLGLFEDFKPKFVKKYANVKGLITTAVKEFSEED